jgi:hypothetical protein
MTGRLHQDATYREGELADLGILRNSRGLVGCEDSGDRAHKGGDGGANHDYSWRMDEEFEVVRWFAGTKEVTARSSRAR